MSLNDIQELLKLISKLKFSEFKMKDGEFEISVRSKEYSKARLQSAAVSNAPSIIPMQSPIATMPATAFAPPAPAVEAMPAAPASKAAATQEAADTNNYLEVRSPIVGTFYRSPSPDSSPYVKIGDTIQVGEVVCVVEAMKLFNEIESEVSGTIVKVLVEDAQPIEYDQVLFLVEA